MNITYLISPTAIKYLTNISDNLSEKYITTAIRETQQVDLCQVLGDNLLVSIENMVTDGSIQDDENRAYKTLLDNYVSYFLAYGTVVKLIPIVAVKIDNAGAVQNGDEKVENISLKDMFGLSDFYMQKADYYKARLQKYLREHYKDYPQLDCSSEIHSAYSSPFYLGGMRHKRVPRGHSHGSGTSTPVVLRTINYYVDNVLFTSAKYATGQLIKHVEAPIKENQHFNVWLYEKNGSWHNLPDYMPDFDINAYAHYIWEEGEQWTYQIGFKVAEGYSDADVHFGNMCYINEPFEWLQEVERGYDPNTREGWARLSHPSLRFDTAISCQKFVGYDKLETLDLHELNNVSLTDRMFFDCSNLHYFVPPKGLVGMQGYDFYNSNLTYINFKTDNEYAPYQSFSAPMTGSFCFCPKLTGIYADNQPFMHSDNGNLYDSENKLMAARSSEVVLADNCTAILSEAIKGRYITTLTIPNSVRRIEVYAVADNNELTDVYFGGTMQDWANIEKDDVNTIFTNTQVNVIHCSDGDCPIDYAGEEQAEYKVDIFIEWDYLETRWLKVGERIELPEPPQRDGYVFMSWNAIVPGGDWFDMPEYMPDYDFEVHASYSANSYKLTYKVDGEIVSETDVEYGTGIIAMEEPVKEGHTFSGWSEIPETMPAHDVEVTGSFTINSYDVYYTLYDENGDIYLNDYVTYRYNDLISPYLPAIPEGYTFSWENEPVTMPAHDVTVTGSMAKVEEPETIPYEQQYFTIEALESGTFTVSGSSTTFQMSTDNGSTWNTATSVELNEGEKVLVKSTLSKGKILGGVSSTGNFNAYGNTMSLVYGDGFKGKTDLTGYTWVFNNFFKNCLKLIDASNLILPATTLADYCYQGMFNNCIALVVAPELPALTMKTQCYKDMFFSCESLQAPPQLPATTLASACYSGMFRWCNFTDISDFELPATTLAYGCYSDMFRQCKKLVNAGLTMPALNLADNCCRDMFNTCDLLTTAPVLSATTLENYCYNGMFNGCKKLPQIIMLATDISADNCLNDWLKSVTSFGILYKSPDMPAETIQTYVPSSWTIEDVYTLN